MTQRRRAEEAAARLLDDTDTLRLPINVDLVAQRLGLQTIFERLEGEVSGTVFRDPDGSVVIGVNTYHSPTRQRFTVAHELGHWAMHVRNRSRPEVFVDRPTEVLFRDRLASEGLDSKEIQANAFAAALLMPEDLVRTEARRYFRQSSDASDSGLVRSLAKKFDVSEQAMRYRLVNLDIVDPV